MLITREDGHLGGQRTKIGSLPRPFTSQLLNEIWPLPWQVGPMPELASCSLLLNQTHGLTRTGLAPHLASSPQSPIEFVGVGRKVSILPSHPQRSAETQTSNFPVALTWA